MMSAGGGDGGTNLAPPTAALPGDDIVLDLQSKLASTRKRVDELERMNAILLSRRCRCSQACLLQMELLLSAQKVTTDFVQQYYYILEHSLENLYHFYEESSTVSRPDSNGMMASVTTVQGQQAITDMVLLLDYYKDCHIKIATVESQLSFNDSVTILVAGSLTGPENFQINFCLTFFLHCQK